MAMNIRTKMLSLSLFVLASCDVAGCSGSAMRGPTLSQVMARVDVPRLLECAGRPSGKQIAKCLGARALTQGLQIAIDEARRLAEDAELASSGAGAADYNADDRAELAIELDAALQAVASEIAATHE